MFLGFAQEKCRKESISSQAQKLQRQITFTTAMYQREKTDILLFRLEMLHKQLKDRDLLDRHLEYAEWVCKLNKLDYQKSTRSFFAELGSRKKGIEYYGPIMDTSGDLSTTLHGCLENWASYYSKLYKKTNNQLNADLAVIQGNTKLGPKNLELLNEDITLHEIIHAINSLKDYSTPGDDMILSRDFTVLLHMEPGKTTEDYPESWTILHFLWRVISNFWTNGRVPQQVKQTVIRPFLKAEDKDPTNPDFYRPIALLNIVRKVYEQILKTRLQNNLEEIKFFSKTQAAYRTGRSTCDHILVLQEVFLHYRFGKVGEKKKIPLYLCFLDLRKAFDTVPRKILFAKLEALGIDGKFLEVIRDLFTGTIARVRIADHYSPSFEIQSGVMQGSKLGPLLFIIFLNDLLLDIESKGLGAMVGELKISSLCFADDIMLITDSPNKLQKLINICGMWSIKNGMRFKIDKCKVMTLNLQIPKESFYLLGEEVKFVSEYKYLGVTFSNKRQTSLITHHISTILEKAERRINCIRHFGFQSDGLRPATSIMMYKTLVRPILEYAAQVLCYRHYYYRSGKKEEAANNKIDEHVVKLEAFQNRMLKKLVPCPKSTSPAIVRILTGTMPIAARIDILKLRYFWKISNSTEHNLAFSILKFKKEESHTKVGFIHEVHKLCLKHNCLNVWLKISRPKENTLKTISRAVESFYINRDLQKCCETTCLYTSLIFNKNIKAHKKYTFEIFFKHIGQFPDTKGRSQFIFALLDTCNFERECPLCGDHYLDVLQHTLRGCPKARQIQLLLKMKLELFNFPGHVNLANKVELFTMAVRNRLYRKVVCEYLTNVYA